MNLCIDRAWCDALGVFLQGWAHWGANRFDSLALCSGPHRQALDLQDRPDIQAAFPDVPRGQPTGFRGYLACPPFTPVTVELAAGSQTIQFPVSLHPEVGPPEILGTRHAEAPIPAFAAAMKARRGTVLEIGARAVGAHSSLNAPLFAPECRFIGCDIHAAPGVDLVADAHYLSQAVPPGSLDGVFSLAVLEHLAAPWLVAAEINRVLRLGGETLHLVPHAWPVHEQPNDFWRFSEAGLASLFGPATGFEVIEAGLATPVQIVPPPEARFGAYLDLPLVFAFAGAFIHARKTSELPGAVEWPLPRDVSEARSRAYPAHAGTG